MSNYVDEYRQQWEDDIDAAFAEECNEPEHGKILGHIDPDGTFHEVVEGEVVEGDSTQELPSSSTEPVRPPNYVPLVSYGPVDGETRVVDPETGGMKGSKLARFDMIPADVLWDLAEHYGKGEAKYPSDPETGEPNWQKGYDWRLSVAALERHLNAWKRGEDFDPETGSSHLVAVMWHAAALRWFQRHGRGKDYRDVANGRAA